MDDSAQRAYPKNLPRNSRLLPERAGGDNSLWPGRMAPLLTFLPHRTVRSPYDPPSVQYHLQYTRAETNSQLCNLLTGSTEVWSEAARFFG